ncbi:MAG TPA: M56 family metallopeptidase [Gemmatimonadales bacterium]|nr:M56 family metallopeptidase [Gemmatimonadales bacterium]
MIAILMDTVVKATLLLLCAAAGIWLLRRSPAALRHLVWALACGGVLVLPVASALLPNWRLAGWPRFEAPIGFDVHAIAAPIVAEVSRVEAAPSISGAPALAPVASVTPQAPAATADAPIAVAAEIEPGKGDWTSWVVVIWLSGVAVVLILLALGLARIWWLDRLMVPLLDESWLDLAADLSRELGLGENRVRLLQAKGPAMPMTWGIRQPAILLPAEADEWSRERRRDVLLHELAHVKRHDFLIQLMAHVACAVYWFHPLVWLAARRLREERERACDDQVLRAGATPSAYATHLLEIARSLRAARATSLTSVAMARPAQLATRLIDVLDAGRRRDTLSARSAMPAWIAAIVIVMPLAAAAPRPPVAEPAPTKIDTIPRMPKPAVVARTPRPAPPPRSAPSRVTRAVAVDTLRGCSERSQSRRSTSSSTNENDDDLTIVTTVGPCTVRLSSFGKFQFTKDFSDIASVPSGGQLVIEVDYGTHDRRLTVRPHERIYKIDGEVRPFDADAKRWLAETLTFLLRRTGYEAEARARWILETRGIEGLIEEFGELTGDYTRRIYYQAAVESGKLDPAGYERLVTLAGQTIDSDYELAELLISISKTQPLTERMQTGFVTAAQSISSDYERHRVLKAALSRPGLTAASQSAMLDAASDINSDYELAELLIELNTARKIDEAVRPAYFKAANSLSSDYEHRRVLDAVVSRTGMTPAMLADVLESAQSINSDYELAELLIKIGGSYQLDEALRPPYFAAAGSINSDYEHARVLRSVVERGEVSRPVALAALESAKGISSDHELAELLIAIIRKVKLDSDIRAAVRGVAQTIGSQYDRGRVFEALGVKET